MSGEALPQSGIILYQTEDGRTRIQCRFENETVWLSLNQMADLFQRDKSVVSRHIKNIFAEGELSEAATVAKSATVQIEGGKQVSRKIESEIRGQPPNSHLLLKSISYGRVLHTLHRSEPCG